MTFRIGQKVICVNDQWAGYGPKVRNDIPCPLKRGCVYVVDGYARPSYAWESDGRKRSSCGLLIAGIPNYDWHGMGINIGFDPRRFRPVVEPKAKKSTDITIFTDMLKTAPEKVRVLQ